MPPRIISPSDNTTGYSTPVNIDASLTSLSAGSLTTVARADHVHTVSNTMVRLGATTLGSTASSVTFSNIPSTYAILKIFVDHRTNSATSGNYTCLRFNSDSGSNYGHDGTSNETWVGEAATSYTSSTTNTYSVVEYTIFNANSTSKWKAVNAFRCMFSWGASDLGGAAAYGGGGGSSGGFWKSTSAVSSVSIISNNGSSFVSGTSITVYGVP